MPFSADEYRRLRLQGLTQEQAIAKLNSQQPQPQQTAAAPAPKARAPGQTGFSEVASDVGIGALKKAAHSAIGAVDLVKRGLDFIANKTVGGKRTENLGEVVPEKTLEPTTTAQKVGGAAEQIGEFFLPGGITKGVRASLKVATAPDIIKILARGALGAAEAASVTAVQGGNAEQVANAAKTGGAFDVIPAATNKLLESKAGQSVVRWLTEKIPSRMVNSILRPAEKDFHFGRNPGLGVVEEGITANTRGDLLIKIADKKHEIGQAIDEALSAPAVASKTIDVTPALAPIEEAVKKATKSGEQDLVRRLLDLRDGLTQEFDLVGRDLVNRGPKRLALSPKEVQQMKIELGQATRWTGQAFDSDINRVKTAVYRNLDGMVDKAAPGTEELNARYANMLTAEKSLERTNNHLQKLVLAGLKVSGFGGLGYVASAAQGDSTPEALAKGAGAAALTKFLGSTPVKTRFAQYLNALAPSERESLIQAIPTLRNVILGLREKGDNAANDQNQ